MKEGQEILLVESSEQEAQQVEQAFRKAQIRNRIKRVADVTAARACLSEAMSGGGQQIPIFVLIGSGGIEEVREFLGWARQQTSLENLPVVLLRSNGPDEAGRDLQIPGATAVFRRRLDFKNLGALVKAVGGFWMLQTATAEGPGEAAAPLKRMEE